MQVYTWRDHPDCPDSWNVAEREWRAGDMARSRHAARDIEEEVVYADDEVVVTKWLTRGDGWNSMCRTPEEMDRYMERVG